MADGFLRSVALRTEQPLHDRGVAHLHVRVYGTHPILCSGDLGDREQRVRLAELRHDPCRLDIVGRGDRWLGVHALHRHLRRALVPAHRPVRLRPRPLTVAQPWGPTCDTLSESRPDGRPTRPQRPDGPCGPPPPDREKSRGARSGTPCAVRRGCGERKRKRGAYRGGRRRWPTRRPGCVGPPCRLTSLPCRPSAMPACAAAHREGLVRTCATTRSEWPFEARGPRQLVCDGLDAVATRRARAGKPVARPVPMGTMVRRRALAGPVLRGKDVVVDVFDPARPDESARWFESGGCGYVGRRRSAWPTGAPCSGDKRRVSIGGTGRPRRRAWRGAPCRT